MVNGLGKLKDAKLYPGGGREWDWRETNTQHDPGIQVLDVQELLDKGAEYVVLSKGMLNRLKTAKETIEFLESKKIEYYIAESPEAVRKYNHIVQEGKAVGGLIHSTC